MALPAVGQDINIWGDELNAWLLIAHNSDGTTKTFYKTSQITTISDADFATPPPNGFVGVGFSTLDGSTRIWVRSNGAWKSVAAT